MMATKPRKMITGDEATPSSRQHRQPCSDCPLRRDAVPGWLGESPTNRGELATAAEWIDMLHGETRIDCHTRIGPQCAGAAIYRGNVCKMPRDRELLVLPADDRRVFSDADEFRERHGRGERKR